MPSRAALTPSTADLTPSRADLTPSRADLTPSRAALTPSRSALTPSTADLTPSRAALTPSRADLTHSRAALTPSGADLPALHQRHPPIIFCSFIHTRKSLLGFPYQTVLVFISVSAAERLTAASVKRAAHGALLWLRTCGSCPLVLARSPCEADPMPLVLYTHWLHAGSLTFIFNLLRAWHLKSVLFTLPFGCIVLGGGCSHIYSLQLQHLEAARRHQQAASDT